jgi:hypothetical protein
MVRKGARSAPNHLLDPRTTPLSLKGVVVVRGAILDVAKGA